MSGRPAQLTYRPLGYDDEPDVIGLLASALGNGPTGGRTTEFYRWKHRLNPFGESPGLVAEDDGRIVGVRLFLRWQLVGREGRVRALRAVDTATHPEYRGRGIFRDLTLRLLEQLDLDDEVDLVFNTPNEMSRPGYLKMGWHTVGTLPVKVGIAKPYRFARGAWDASASTAGSRRASASGVPIVEEAPVTHLPCARTLLDSRAGEVAALAASAAAPAGLHTPVTPQYLAWRYGSAPGLDYRCIPVESGGELAGVGFGRMRRRGPLNEFTLADVLVRAGDRRSVRRVLASARRSGADHVTLHTSRSDVLTSASVSGYLTVPRYGLNLVANPRRPVAPDPLVAGSWSLSLGDLELF